MRLRLRDHTFQLAPGRPILMGIVNVGDDSVADPLHLADANRAIAYARAQAAAGARIIDIGFLSGRTDTAVAPIEVELARLEPVVRALAREGLCVSVDTYRAAVAEALLDAGASLINDVSGLADPQIVRLCAGAGAGLVLMHTRAAPKSEHFPGYEDALGDVVDFLAERTRQAHGEGLSDEQLLIDPGLDFAKSPQDSVAILRGLGALAQIGPPILLATSRKYFIGMLTGTPPLERLPGTLAAIAHGVAQGAHVLRVHDVQAVGDFLAVAQALDSHGQISLRGDPEDATLKWIAPKGPPQSASQAGTPAE
jgi:dihydropteroate synthase